MAERLPWLRASGRDIVDENGRPVLLKGYCLGGWLNTENFINGYPFVDHLFFKALCDAIGQVKAAYYYERQYEYYLQEADIAFLKECGTNAVRLPFNYRLFETDAHRGDYTGPGWDYFDRIVRWCRDHGLYIMLDLHAAQGWQNPDWHCDNPANVVLLWDSEDYRERVGDLWQAIAEHYRDEPTIAGYELLNEPVHHSVPMLHAFYEEVVEKIRRVDPRHIVFVEGNMWGSDFEGFEPLHADNIVYACHIYTGSDFEFTPYPHDGANPKTFAAEYAKFVKFQRRHDLPMWCSEFGAHHYSGNAAVRRGRLQTIDDQISHFESVGHSWSMWTYKDVGVMGIAALDPKSRYMQRTAPVRKLKARLGADVWTDTDHAGEKLLKPLVDAVKKAGGKRLDRGAARGTLSRYYRDGIGRLLLKPFAGQFKGMSNRQIDTMMKSWKLENCRVNEGLVKLLRKHAAAQPD